MSSPDDIYWWFLLIFWVVVFSVVIGWVIWLTFQPCPTYHQLYQFSSPDFCPRCGDELRQYCDCGRELSDEDSYCRDCGASRPD